MKNARSGWLEEPPGWDRGSFAMRSLGDSREAWLDRASHHCSEICSQFARREDRFFYRSHHLQRLDTGGIGLEHFYAKSDLGTFAPVFQEKPTRLDIHKPSRLH